MTALLVSIQPHLGSVAKGFRLPMSFPCGMTGGVELRDIRCFVAVADARHFGRAAEQLHLSQPTVSKAVRRLESHVGGELIDRSTQPVTVTPLGDALRDQVHDALGRLDGALESARRSARLGGGQISVGYTADVGRTLVASCIAEVHRRDPEQRVAWMNESTAEQVAMVQRRELDAGIGWLPPPSEHLEQRVVATLGFAALVTTGDVLARRRPISTVDLPPGGVTLWPRSPNPALFDHVAGALETGGVGPVAEAKSGLEELAALVLAGETTGIVPAGYARFRPVEGLLDVAIDESLPGVGLSAFWRADDARNEVAAFVDLVADLAMAALSP